MERIPAQEHRILHFHILRHNPAADAPPRLQTFLLEEAETMTLYIALTELRESQDPSLQFDFVCRAGICGSCGMLINGRPGLACRTLTRELPDEITLLPLPGFELIGDLSVNTGKWMRAMSERLQTWVHSGTDIDESVNPGDMEDAMEPEEAQRIYELDRCIECGCCIAACGTARMNERFIGAVGLIKIARFRADSRDLRSDEEYYQMIGDEDGVFGCMTLLGCEDFCPKNLPLAAQIAFLRRKMLLA